MIHKMQDAADVTLRIKKAYQATQNEYLLLLTIYWVLEMIVLRNIIYYIITYNLYL